MSVWKLVFEEDFSQQTQLNLDHWVIDTGEHGGGNNESQYYTPGNHNLFFEDGALVFEGRKEKYLTRDYTSAKIWTKGKHAWQYGRFEIVAKLPRGKGTWPAIWTLGVNQGHEKWPAIGEIDIMEHIGKNQDHIHFSLHTEKYNHRINTQPTFHTDIPKVSDEFKTYVIEWDEDQIAFFVDGVHYVTFKKEDYADSWPFDKPHYLILNLALGGGWGGVIDDSCLPQRMTVQSVRIYQKG